MPHNNSFTRTEIQEIRQLLQEKIDKPANGQKKTRDILRKKYGFYVSDFNRVPPYTPEDLEDDIKLKNITIVP